MKLKKMVNGKRLTRPISMLNKDVMKKVLTFLGTFVAILSIASCTTVRPVAENVKEEAKGNFSATFHSGKVVEEDGTESLEVSGSVSTKIYKIRPYASFAAGIAYEKNEDDDEDIGTVDEPVSDEVQ